MKDGKTSERSAAIDIIRGVCIILVVAGHCCAPVRNFIYLFHVPAFFIAAGYCYNSRAAADFRSMREFLKKRFRRLWLPYAFWFSMFTFSHNLFLKIHVYTDNPHFFDTIGGGAGRTSLEYTWTIRDMLYHSVKACLLHDGCQLLYPLWFLTILLAISVIYCAVDYCSIHLLKNRRLLTVQTCVSGITLAAGYSCALTGQVLFQMDKVFSCYVLFHIGYLIRRKNFLAQPKRLRICALFALGSFILLLILNHFGTLELAANSYVNPAFLLLASLSGWVFLYESAYILNSIRRLGAIKRALLASGKHTMPVLILHILSFKLINALGVLFEGKPKFLIAACPVLYRDGVWWLLYTVTGVMVPLLLDWMWNHLRWAAINTSGLAKRSGLLRREDL